MRFDFCNFDVHQSKWWSQSWSIAGGGSLQNATFSGLMYAEGQVGMFYSVWCNIVDHGALWESLMVYDSSHIGKAEPAMPHWKGWMPSGLSVNVPVLPWKAVFHIQVISVREDTDIIKSTILPCRIFFSLTSSHIWLKTQLVAEQRSVCHVHPPVVGVHPLCTWVVTLCMVSKALCCFCNSIVFSH